MAESAGDETQPIICIRRIVRGQKMVVTVLRCFGASVLSKLARYLDEWGSHLNRSKKGADATTGHKGCVST
jgi:hypothetical protein